MRKLFFKDLGIYGLSTLLVRAINYLLIPVYSRLLSPAEYGVIDLVSVLTYLMGVILFQEYYQAVARYFAESSPREKVEMVSSVTFLYVIIFIPFILILFFLSGKISATLFQTEQNASILHLAAIAMFVNAFLNFYQHVLRYDMQTYRYALVNVIWVLVSVLLTVWFVVFKKSGISGVYLGQICGGMTGLFVACIWVRQFIRTKLNWALVRQLGNFSRPLMVSAIMLYLMTYTDRWMLKSFSGVYDVGIYGLIYKIAAIPMMLVNIVNATLLPHIYKIYGDNRQYGEVANIYAWVFLWGICLVVILSLFQNTVVGIIAGPQYASYAYLFSPILSGGFMMHYSFMFVGTYLKEKTGMTILIYASGLIISMASNFFLIPLYGLYGVALSCLLTGGSILLLQWNLSQAYFCLPLQGKNLILKAIVILIPLMLFHALLASGVFVSLMTSIVLAACAFILALIFNLKYR